MKKYLLFYIPLFLFIIALLSYFYLTIDTLSGFLSDQTIFYLHSDLDKTSYNGYTGFERMTKKYPEIFLKKMTESDANLAMIGLNLTKESAPALKEVGLAAVTDASQKINLILILKSRDLINKFPIVLDVQGKQFFSKELASNVVAISPNKESLDNLITKKNNLFSNFSFEFKNEGFLRGWLDSEKFIALSKTQEQTKSLTNFFAAKFDKSIQNEILKFHFISSPNGLVFKINNQIFGSPADFAYLNLVSFVELNQQVKANFIFKYPNAEPLDILSQRIKMDLALKKPIKKEVKLPDNSSFTEILADPSAFNFGTEKINNTQLRQWRDESGEIAFGQNAQYTFVSNSLTWLENIVQETDRANDIKTTFYWRAGDCGIKQITIEQEDTEISGLIEVF